MIEHEKVIIEKVPEVKGCQFGTMVCLGEHSMRTCKKRKYCYRYIKFTERDMDKNALPLYCLVLQDINFENGCMNYMEVV